MQKAKLSDVARHAGVSITTASQVVNNKGNISHAVCQRVMQAIEELDYKRLRAPEGVK